MKNIRSVLSLSAVIMAAACGSSPKNASSIASTEAEPSAPVASCEEKIAEPTQQTIFGYQISVEPTKLIIQGLSLNALIAPKVSAIEEVEWTTQPVGQLLHSCLQQSPYKTVGINVYEDVVVIQRYGSPTEFYSPRVFKILGNNDTSAHIPSWGSVQKVRFFRDARPADGVLREILLTKNSEGTYDASLHIVTPGFGAPVEDRTEELGERLRCENGFADEQGTLTNVMCSCDQRPVDGVLTKVLFSINADGKYDARKVVIFPDFGGPSVPQVTDLGSGLALEILQ